MHFPPLLLFEIGVSALREVEPLIIFLGFLPSRTVVIPGALDLSKRGLGEVASVAANICRSRSVGIMSSVG